MAAAEEVQFSLKVMMIKQSSRVIYAEGDSDFAVVLLSFLTLPLGTIVRLLVKHHGNNIPTVGNLNFLYAGLLNLDSGHFRTEADKLMLLNPRNSSEIECSRLKLQIDDTPPTQASFLLTDDLFMLTNKSASLLQILKLNGIEDTSVLGERTLTFGLKEVNLCYIDLLIMELLKGSLVSETPITDIILSDSSAAASVNKRKKYEPYAFPHTQTQTSENISSESNITVSSKQARLH
ncbi:uncharacterized protein LOC142544111 [Primulina tabacum]|uniref:uncharacterized protein LOC142544111 n=1 Tax=Primulina tabacum TaxID=48773 RepID=UPI003F5AA042